MPWQSLARASWKLTSGGSGSPGLALLRMVSYSRCLTAMACDNRISIRRVGFSASAIGVLVVDDGGLRMSNASAAATAIPRLALTHDLARRRCGRDAEAASTAQIIGDDRDVRAATSRRAPSRPPP